MNNNSLPFRLVTEIAEHDLDGLLRREFMSTISNDDGFTQRVMRKLPQKRPQRRWLMPTALVAGALLVCLLLPPTLPLQQAASQWLSGEFGGGALVLSGLIFAVGLLASAWSLEEAV